MSFEEYLADTLSKPTHESYDPDGNSDRARVVRGRFKEILWQYRAFPGRYLRVLKSFRGADTPIGWFIEIPLATALSPVLPLIVGLRSYSDALGEYKAAYERSNKSNQSS